MEFLGFVVLVRRKLQKYLLEILKYYLKLLKILWILILSIEIFFYQGVQDHAMVERRLGYADASQKETTVLVQILRPECAI